MGATISKQQVILLQNKFAEHLRILYPEWAESTITTHKSDAFYALNNNIGVDFWASLISEQSILVLSEILQKRFEKEKHRVSGYLVSVKLLKKFLDEKHDSLALDWSGQTVSSVNLRLEYRQWMQKQVKSNNEPYSHKTIGNYLSALKNSASKLMLSSIISTDLFYYSDAQEFQRLYDEIRSAPNFAEVDAEVNRSFSAALPLYLKFLESFNDSSIWVFQGNPKYYDVAGAINDLRQITWAVNQSPKQIKQGDKVYIWISGANSGIIASGKILCNPEMRKPDLNTLTAKVNL